MQAQSLETPKTAEPEVVPAKGAAGRHATFRPDGIYILGLLGFLLALISIQFSLLPPLLGSGLLLSLVATTVASITLAVAAERPAFVQHFVRTTWVGGAAAVVLGLGQVSSYGGIRSVLTGELIVSGRVVQEVVKPNAESLILPSRPDSGLAEACRDSARQGDVQVAVTHLSTEARKAIDDHGPYQALVIQIRVENHNPVQTLSLLPWAGQARWGARLADRWGNRFSAISKADMAPIEVPPGGTAVFDLAFRMPVVPLRRFVLELPGAAFGGRDSLAFQISHRTLLFELGHTLGTPAIPYLRQALVDPDAQVRARAAQLASDFRFLVEGMLTELQRLIHDRDPLVRRVAIEAASDWGADSRDAFTEILQAVADDDETVRKAALRAVDKLGGPQRADLDTLLRVLKRATTVLRLWTLDQLAGMELDPRVALPLFLETARDSSDAIQIVGVQALGKLGMDARAKVLPTLFSVLKHCDDEVRPVVISALNGMEPFAEAEVPLLIDVLADASTDGQLYAIRQLRELGAKAVPAAEPTIRMLKGGNSRLLRPAALALGRMGPEAVPALREAMRENNEKVRIGASFALAQMGSDARSAAADLVEALADPCPTVRENACQAVAGLGTNGKVGLTQLGRLLRDPERSVRQQAMAAIVKIGPERFLEPALVGALDDPESETRDLAMGLLEPFQPLSANTVPALRSALLSPVAGVRVFAARSLGQIGKAALPAAVDLKRALKDSSEVVRLEAMRALICIGPDTETVGALLQAAQSDDEALSVLGVWGLGKLQRVAPSDVPVLAGALRSPKNQVKLTIIELIEKLGPQGKAAVPEVALLLREPDERLHRQAAVVLGKMGASAWQAVPALAKATHHKDQELRKRVVQALGEIGPVAHAAVPDLIAVLDEPALIAEASHALVRIGKPAVPALVDVLEATDDYVRRMSAIAILGRIGPDAADATDILRKLGSDNMYLSIRQSAREALQKIQAHATR